MSDLQFWRSVDELQQSDEFQKAQHDEFLSEPLETDNVSRRSFLQLMGASVAMASLGGCILRRKETTIVPYGELPENMVLGNATYYASSFNLTGDVHGLLVECHEGRPTKLEGLKGHIVNDGRLSAIGQAQINGLYDTDRSFSPRKATGEVTRDGSYVSTEASWDDFDAFWSPLKTKYDSNNGEGLSFLIENDNSPTFIRLANEMKRRYPQAKWYRHAPVDNTNAREGTALAFGQTLNVVPDYSKADVIVSLDCDFLGVEPGHVKATKEFSQARRLTSSKSRMNRLYVAESRHSLTGGKADHRLAMTSHDVMKTAFSLVNRLAKNLPELLKLGNTSSGREQDDKRLNLMADDLLRAGNKALVVAGIHQPPVVHAVAAAINAALGAGGTTVQYYKEHDLSCDSIVDCARALDAKEIETLFVFDANPVYSAPADLAFGSLLKKATHTVHLGLHHDETGKSCQWHLNSTHFLEAWGDWLTTEGRVSLQQPVIEPISTVVKDSKVVGRGGPALSDIELLSRLTGDRLKGHDLVRTTWQSKLATQKAWRGAVEKGFVASQGYSSQQPSIRHADIKTRIEMPTVEGIEVTFMADSKVHDGRYANNTWLQELPDPVTKIGWDNPIMMSYKTDPSVSTGDEIEVTLGNSTVKGVACIVPGHAPGNITLTLGYGRLQGGRVARDLKGQAVGHNYYQLRTSSDAWMAGGARIRRTGRKHKLANTQNHSVMHGRKIVQQFTKKEYEHNPTKAQKINLPHTMEDKSKPFTDMRRVKSLQNERLYAEGYEGYQWGMTIDLTSCTGCAACTVACQSENNIPVVGKEQMTNGREMHWIRMDRYFVSGTVDNPLDKDKGQYTYDDENIGMVTMPVACQHCENAPCEEVCPVAATTHSAEGLNDMSYNRCIGTRYCLNNCPYKVRRYNYYHWSQKNPWTTGDDWTWDTNVFYDHLDRLDTMQANPNVSVRFRGVMEKCTFCVQRINRSRITAKTKGLQLSDKNGNTPVPACAQSCPADAISFGNINEKNSKVSQLRAMDRGYRLLEEMNWKPRSTYLSSIKNTHPDWS